MQTGEYRFFEKYFDIYSYTEEEDPTVFVIKFEHFEKICYDCEKFNKSNLPNFLEKIRRICRDKLRNKNEEILINRVEFYQYIELITKDNDKQENEKDPELKEIFLTLAGEQETLVDRKKLGDIIESFELPIKIDDFFGPLKKKEVINFAEFCSLFKKKTDGSDMLFSTFYSSFYKANDPLSSINESKKDNFPIRFNVKEIY